MILFTSGFPVVGNFCQVRTLARQMSVPLTSIFHASRKPRIQKRSFSKFPIKSTPANNGDIRVGIGRGLTSKTACSDVEDKVLEVPVWAEESTLYVHWPYCEKRCTYCNFNKYISKTVDHERMKNCLVKETTCLIQRSHVKEIKTIFFGGGTPSLALPSTIESVISAVRNQVHLPDDAEVTLEVNPTSTEASSLHDFKLAGTNRISLGIQTLDEKDLELLGRQHSVSEALRCLEAAKRLFPGRTSVDLMFGRPGQTLSKWRSELHDLLEVCDDHLSLYQLTLERGTSLFKQVKSGNLSVPGAEEMADMYNHAVDTLEEAGFKRYEASNFARNDAESIHNQAYWRGSQYIGVGPGAHGRFRLRERPEIPRWAFTQTLEPIPWMVEVERYGHATRRAVPQDTTEVLGELLMLGMRTAEGIPQKRWDLWASNMSLLQLFGQDSYVQELIKMNMIKVDKCGLCATRNGLNVVDNITGHLLHLLQESLTKYDNL